MVESSSPTFMTASQQSNHGIEMTERKSAQFSTREIMEPHQSGLDPKDDSSNDQEDTTKSTNIDRHDMERMGKRCSAHKSTLH
jgi:hypothetical protein